MPTAATGRHPGRYVHVNGVDLYSEVDGRGDPVLLLHGGFCSLESLRAQADALAADRRVLAFERPGHGRSPDVDGEFSYERGLDDVLAYLDAHDLDDVDVIGYSDGGILGLLLALEHPRRVRSLVAISANLDPTAFAHPPLDGVAVPEEEPGGTPEDPERLHYERLSPDGAGHADVVLAKLLRLWAAEPRIDPAELTRIVAPTLVMSGAHDIVRPDHSALIAASIPGARLCIVPETTHDLVTERPDAISATIREFLASRP